MASGTRAVADKPEPTTLDELANICPCTTHVLRPTRALRKDYCLSASSHWKTHWRNGEWAGRTWVMMLGFCESPRSWDRNLPKEAGAISRRSIDSMQVLVRLSRRVLYPRHFKQASAVVPDSCVAAVSALICFQVLSFCQAVREVRDCPWEGKSSEALSFGDLSIKGRTRPKALNNHAGFCQAVHKTCTPARGVCHSRLVFGLGFGLRQVFGRFWPDCTSNSECQVSPRPFRTI